MSSRRSRCRVLGERRISSFSAYLLFLIDTGADVTVIHPRDMAELGVQPERDLAGSTTRVEGIGGTSRLYIEPCGLEFVHTDGVTDRVEVPLYFAEPTAMNVRNRSLLGWDVLADYRVIVERASGLVALEYPRGAEIDS